MPSSRADVQPAAIDQRRGLRAARQPARPARAAGLGGHRDDAAAPALAEALEQDGVDRAVVAGRRRRRQRAELALPAHAAGGARDRVQRAVVLQQVDPPPAQHGRELEQHAAAQRPRLAVGRARRALDREVVRARLREAVDRPRKAVVGGMLVGTRARGGRGGRVLVGVHEPDVRVERVVIAVEHRQRDADPEHEEHGPDREPRKRTLAAGRRAHPKDGRGRAGRRRRSPDRRPDARRLNPTARDETVAMDDLRERLRELPCGERLLDGRGGHERRAPRRRRGARPAAGPHAERARRRRRRRRRCRSRRASARRRAGPIAHERFATATVRVGECRWDLAERARGDLRASRRAARRACRGHAGAGPAAPRRDDQRARARSRRRDAARRARTPRRTWPRAACACCTTRASPTTRRGCGAWRATPRGWASRSRSARRGSRPRPSPAGRWRRCRAPRIGNELRLALAEPDPVAALDAAVAIGAAPWLAPDRALTERALELLPPGEGRRDLLVLAAALPSPAATTRCSRAWSSPPPSARSCARASPRRRSRTDPRPRASALARALRDLPRRGRRAGRARAARRRRRAAGWTSCATSGCRSPATTCWRRARRRARSSAAACRPCSTSASTVRSPPGREAELQRRARRPRRAQAHRDAVLQMKPDVSGAETPSPPP